MTIYSKQPQASVDYVIDWGSSLKGRSVAASDWSIHPAEPGGLAGLAGPAGPTATCVTLSGGLPGHDYRISGQATFVNGGVATRDLLLRVAPCREAR